MLSKKMQATVVLLIMLLGFIITYNESQWWGQLLNAGFMAGLIGGLADWFAVTALFRKPLGFISFRTEILPRNRQRIIEEIVGFLGKDLLNNEYILYQLDKISFKELLRSCGKVKGVREDLTVVTQQAAGLVSDNVPELILELSNALNMEKIDEVNARKWSGKIYQQILVVEDDKVLVELWSVGINGLQCLLNQTFVHQILDSCIEEITDLYVGENFGRSAAVGFLDLSGPVLAKKFIKYFDNVKGELEEPHSRLNRYLQIKGARKLRSILNDPSVWEFLIKFIKDNIQRSNTIENTLKDVELKPIIAKELYNFSLEQLEGEEELERISQWLKIKVADFVVRNSEFQLNYMRQELNRYSNEELIALVENKVGDDLQMIRINGSLVGSIAGMILFLISAGVERIWG